MPVGIRRNAALLSATERESLVKAFVLMKADIVNPEANPNDRYSRWDEFVAVHWFIQGVCTPDGTIVNFAHGGRGHYGFLSWHRWFLHLFEQQLQRHVAGVTLPYWDWTDPTPAVMVADFMGPGRSLDPDNKVLDGFFAEHAPGTGGNTVPAPTCWPAHLAGWLLPDAFGPIWKGALRRSVKSAPALPSVHSIQSALRMRSLHEFQAALEAGTGVDPAHTLHNGLHGWFGLLTHMSSPASPFDPMFYLHHCNVDRLWAMWQADGHAGEFPSSGGVAHHHRTDPMFPWVGKVTGYASTFQFDPITLPDFRHLGPITPEDVLDHDALGYTYDTLSTIDVALDRSSSMRGLTPDPMTTPAPDRTKLEAAAHGVASLLQDCEAAHAGSVCSIVVDLETFGDAAGHGNEAALADVFSSLGRRRSGQSDGRRPRGRRCVAGLFGGRHGHGSLPGSLLTQERLQADTAVFALGFGTPADVDLVAAEATFGVMGSQAAEPHVMLAENAGGIDHFCFQVVSAAMGFTPLMSGVELFEGEHTHVEFAITSGEEVLFLTVQGMDFEDQDWSYHLAGPAGHAVYDDGRLPAHAHGEPNGHHGVGGRQPKATARRGNGRLSLFVQRDSAGASAWVGVWSLTIAWRARELDAMTMVDPAEWLVPVVAGPIRGPRYARLLQPPHLRKAARAVPSPKRHCLDLRPTSTSRDHKAACTAVVNLSARTRLQMTFRPDALVRSPGETFTLTVTPNLLRGSVSHLRGVARLLGPAQDLNQLVQAAVSAAPQSFDSASLLAKLEEDSPDLGGVHDEQLEVVSKGHGLHVHVGNLDVAGRYHIGLFLRGLYAPAAAFVPGGHTASDCAPEGGEQFTRILSASVEVVA